MGGGQHRPLRDRAARSAIFAVFPYPQRLKALAGPLRALQRTGLDRLVARSGLPARAACPRRSHGPGPEAGRRDPPGGCPSRGRRTRYPARGGGHAHRLRAVLVFFPQVNIATARVLAAEGCEVVIPRGQGCGGVLSLHSGRASEAAGVARHAIETFEQADVEVIVVNSAGCGSAMKEYAELLADDPAWADRAVALSAKVRDFAEFLARLFESSGRPGCPPASAAGPGRVPRRLPPGPRAEGHRRAARAAGRHPGPGASGDPRGRDVLRLGRGLQPAAARGGPELGLRKATTVRSTGTRLLISANPGCSLQIASAVEAQGGSIAIAHTAEILDASIRGVPAPEPG